MFPVVLLVAGAGVAVVDDDGLVGEAVEEVGFDVAAFVAGGGGGEFGVADELGDDLADEVGDLRLFFVGLVDGDDGEDLGCEARGEDEAFVVGVGHDHRADEAGGYAPAGGVAVGFLLVAAEVLDVEGFGEVLAEVVGGAHLEGFAVLHEGFDAEGDVGAGELFGFGFAAFDDGYGEDVFGEVCVDVEHAEGFFAGLLGGFVGGVAFLPEELGGAEEEAGAHFPAHDVAPLVDQDGEVAVALDPLGVHVADDGFGGGADDEGFFEGTAGAEAFTGGVFFELGVGDDGALHGEAFDVLGFLGEEGLGNEEGEVGVDVAGVFEAAVEVALDAFPDGEAIGLDDHATADGGVVGELGGFDDVEVPLGVVCGAGFDVFGHGGEFRRGGVGVWGELRVA